MKIALVKGVGGVAVYLDDTRISPRKTKPLGGGKTIASYEIDEEYLRAALASPAPVSEAIERAAISAGARNALLAFRHGDRAHLTADHALEILEALASPSWRDISTAPRDGTWILVFHGGDFDHDKWTGHSVVRWRTAGRRLSRGPGWFDDRVFEVENVTHWMPLPPAPGEKK